VSAPGDDPRDTAPEQGETDRLYARGEATPGGFRFDAEVARVFADMIARSVPGYAETVALSGWLAGRYGRDDTRIYDLGCALGASLFACARALSGRRIQLVGIDASGPMIDRCRQRLSEQRLEPQPELHRSDLREIDFEPASVVILNWTLQFIPLAERAALIGRIADALVPGGILILSEKMVDPDPRTQAELEQLHLAFKRAQGYSEMEIAAKRSEIENVLVPETPGDHRERLAQAGLEPIVCVARSLNFATLLARKPEVGA
jgi:tRNA (cmo5U34)-methyltransferase